MPDFTSSTTLSRESEVLSRSLIGSPPTQAVRELYVRAHEARPELQVVRPFDRCLVSLARLGPWWAGFADGYARLLAPRSPLRNKFVMLLAILEMSSPSNRVVAAVPSPRSWWVWTLLCWRVSVGLARQLLSLVVLLPVQLSLAFLSRSR